MSALSAEMASFANICNGVDEFEEAGQRYWLLRHAALPAGCMPAQADLLFRLTGQGGYGSMLYFPEIVHTSRVSQVAPNWQSPARILDRNWHWYSWQVPISDVLSPLARLLVHLRPLGA